MNSNPFHEAAFDPETIQVMGQAFEFACIALKDREDFQALKKILAVVIVNAARGGERDPLRMGATAVKACSLNGESL